MSSDDARIQACLAGIQAYDQLVTRGRSARFEAEITVEGSILVVRASRGEARGRLSALWLLAARTTGGAAGGEGPPSLRFPSRPNDARPQALNQAISSSLFRAALALASEGEDLEALFCMRRATHGCAGNEEDWRGHARLPDELLAKAPRKLLAQASGATRVERLVGDFEGSPSALAGKVAPFATDPDPLVRHDCATRLAEAAAAIVNGSAAALAKHVDTALEALIDDRTEYVREQALVAAELLAQVLEDQAESWRVSHKIRLGAVTALAPIADKLATIGVNRERQARRKSLDGTPLPPPNGTESGPWAKTVIEARRILADRGAR